MNKSKWNTLLLVASLIVMVPATLVLTGVGWDEGIPGSLFALCGIVDILALFGFVSGIIKKAAEKMDQSKLFTMVWVVSLGMMVLAVLVMIAADYIVGRIGGEEAVVPLDLVIFCGVAGLLGLFGFSYGMIKKIEERRAERYDELYDNRF